MDVEHVGGVCHHPGTSPGVFVDAVTNSTTTVNVPWEVGWSKAQLVAFAWAPRATGLVSIAASLTIAWIVLRDRKTKLTKTRYRLLLGMSVADLISSTALALSSAPIPRGTVSTYGAIGTTGTCTAQGFAVQLGFVEPTYSCMLSLYFVLAIKWKMRERRIRYCIEPMMHALAWLWPLGTAFAGIGMDLFNSSTTMCWIEPYPHGCSSNFVEIEGIQCPCTRGVNAFFYQIVFAGLQIGVIFVIILWSLTFIICTVRQIEGQTQSAGVRGPGDSGRGGRLRRMLGHTRASPRIRGPRDAHQIKAAAMATQAFLYIWAFLATYTFPIFLTLAQEFALNAPFAVHLFMYILLPFQGFWNFLAFMHPRMKFLRSTCPLESKWNIFKLALIGDPGHGNRGTRALSAFQGEFEQRQLHIGTESRQSSSSGSLVSFESDSSYDYMNDMPIFQREGRQGCESTNNNAPFPDSVMAVDLDILSDSIGRTGEDAQNTNKDFEGQPVSSNCSIDHWADEPPIVNDCGKIRKCSDESMYEDFSDENSDFSLVDSDCCSDIAIDDDEEVYVQRRQPLGKCAAHAIDMNEAKDMKQQQDTTPQSSSDEMEANEPVGELCPKISSNCTKEPPVTQSDEMVDVGVKDQSSNKNAGPTEACTAHVFVLIEEDVSDKIRDAGDDEKLAASQKH